VIDTEFGKRSQKVSSKNGGNWLEALDVKEWWVSNDKTNNGQRNTHNQKSQIRVPSS